MATEGKKLSELTDKVTELKGTERMYVSDGSGVPKYIETCQIKDYLNKGMLGEIRMSLIASETAFGDDFVIADGSPVSVEQYPESTELLPIDGLSDVTDVTFEKIVGDGYQEGYSNFTPVGDMLMRIRQTMKIPEDLENPDYISAYETIETYIDKSYNGKDWIQVCRLFPAYNESGDYQQHTKMYFLNGKLIVFGYRTSKNSDGLPDESNVINTISIASVEDDFQSWETKDLIIPGAPTGITLSYKGAAYGNGVYCIICTEKNGTGSVFTSESLSEWDYAVENAGWSNLSSFYPSVHFCGGRFIFRLGYTIITDLPSGISDDSNIVNPSALGEDMNYAIKGITHTKVSDEELYAAVAGDPYVFLIQKVGGKWTSVRTKSEGLNGVSLIGILGHYPDITVFTQNGKSEIVKSETIKDIPFSEKFSGTIADLGFFGTKAFIKDASANYFVGAKSCSTPNLSSFLSMGICPYIKLKSK